VGHNICALVVADPVDVEAARRLDLVPVALTPNLTLLHIDHYYSAYWQAVRGRSGVLDVPRDHASIFPTETVLADLAAELLGTPLPRFAVILTDYFGGNGEQWACLFEGERRVSPDTARINDVLQMLGVVAARGRDEFDTVGLGDHRRQPEQLERYVELCEEVGA
jgi:hypothetical protein